MNQSNFKDSANFGYTIDYHQAMFFFSASCFNWRLKRQIDTRGGSRPVYKVCTNLSDFFPEKFFLECFCKVQMIPDLMGSGFALQ